MVPPGPNMINGLPSTVVTHQYQRHCTIQHVVRLRISRFEAHECYTRCGLWQWTEVKFDLKLHPSCSHDYVAGATSQDLRSIGHAADVDTADCVIVISSKRRACKDHVRYYGTTVNTSKFFSRRLGCDAYAKLKTFCMHAERPTSVCQRYRAKGWLCKKRAVPMTIPKLYMHVQHMCSTILPFKHT